MKHPHSSISNIPCLNPMGGVEPIASEPESKQGLKCVPKTLCRGVYLISNIKYTIMYIQWLDKTYNHDNKENIDYTLCLEIFSYLNVFFEE